MRVQIWMLLATQWLTPADANRKIDRKKVVSNFNPQRHESSNSTPVQVGNGNFAFGVDVTGLQTFQPFAIQSSWGWHNFSLPTTPGQTQLTDFTGLDWWTHGRLVKYSQPNSAEPEISNWLIQNPQRINLGRIGFWFGSDHVDITESDLSEKLQTLDLYSGIISSQFTVLGSKVTIKTSADPDSDTVAIQIQSDLIKKGQLGVFFDYPYPDRNKFDAPFVGVWNASSLHTTSLQQSRSQAQISHDIDATTYYTNIYWDGEGCISDASKGTHRYVLQANPSHDSTLELTVNYSPKRGQRFEDDAGSVVRSSAKWWREYWEDGAFIDLTGTKDTKATELQRRIILSQYLLAVNEAGRDPPQESGLVNNGWYGKFHMEMVLWHLLQWARWGKWSLLDRSIPHVYDRFLPTSIERARDMGYKGARWGKMSDPTGRSAPGEINSLLIWQQPHPFYFAEVEYRAFPSPETLKKWDKVLTESAEYMVSFAWWNSSTNVFDLGAPMYPVSENTNPNATINPTFELAYWRFGLKIAEKWKVRQKLEAPPSWLNVSKSLAPLPIINSTYPIYEGIPDMWIDPVTYTDHPAMTGIYGLLPPTSDVNLTVVANTANKIASVWDFANLFGWDFPMLAMNAARLGRSDTAIEYLLDPNFAFDDVGMPIGGPRVPTPYFPGSGGLLLAVAMMAGGWDGNEGPKFPKGWDVRAEGFLPAL
ncbi:Uncharacterized protein BP5553_05886 [Venustampulla echinocandica]|uniref:Six-hairpin glycosidase n=1 Tax=Venustampulla echinocandica TaxID=2656787 RepID=A0A370TLX8_9HELO|nr:Uncharacterized protein BP5553_05886 [Venustampulla echinocandica]RDL36534.1 Uncharacterized protein BP5553_05886 [Venustampulla echinocandica]